MKKLCIATLLAVTCTTTTLAQTSKDQEASNSQTIERVVIIGNRRIPESKIKEWLSTRKSRAYKPERLNDDLRALFDTGHFAGVRVYVEGGLSGGKIVTFEVMDKPLIFDINYDGIDPTQQAEILEFWREQKIDLSKGSEYDPVKIRKAARTMQDFLNNEQNQYMRVSPYVEEQTATEVSVIFKIESSSRR